MFDSTERFSGNRRSKVLAREARNEMSVFVSSHTRYEPLHEERTFGRFRDELS